MKLILLLLLQSILMPPRIGLENPEAVSEIPKNLKKDYDKAWARFLTAKEDAKLVQDLDKLLKKKRDFNAIVTLQAYLDLYQSKPLEAERKLELVLSRRPEQRIALYYLAELAFARNDYARASGLYSKLLEVDRNRTDVEPKRQKAFLLATEDLLRSAAKAEQEGRLAAAENLYRAALQIAPREPAFHGQLASLLAKEKKWDEALSHFQKEIELGGPNEEVERQIAETLMNLGRTEEAREILGRLRESGARRGQAPRDEALEAKVDELKDLGRWGQDIEYFHQIEAAGSVTREQLSVMIVRYFPQLTEFRQNPQIVTDIGDSGARAEIQTIVGVGLMDPTPNHIFRPSDLVTRAELAASVGRLSRLLGVSPSAAPPIPLSDLAPSHALYRDIQLVLGYGLMVLDDAGNFNVDGGVPGEEAVRAVERLLALARGNEA